MHAKRVLIAAPNDGCTNEWVARAFNQNEWAVVQYDYRQLSGQLGLAKMNARLVKEALGNDLVLVLKGENVDPVAVKAIREAGVPVAVWNFDPREAKDPFLLALAQSASHFFTIGGGLVPWYLDQGVNAHWLLEGADAEDHFPQPVSALGSVPVAWIGTVDGVPGREAWLVALRTRLGRKLHVWGSFLGPILSRWDTCHGRASGNDGFRLATCSSQVVLGRDRNPEIARSYGARLFRTLACGRAVVTNNTDGIKEDFGDSVFVYDSDEHCQDLVDWVLENPEKATVRAENGWKQVQGAHLFKHRIAEMLHVVGGGS